MDMITLEVNAKCSFTGICGQSNLRHHLNERRYIVSNAFERSMKKSRVKIFAEAATLLRP